MRHRFIILAALAAFATPAGAEQRDFCAERPGQTTPPCTLAPGTVMIETGLIDWSRSIDDSGVTDTTLVGGSLFRAGVTDRLELQVGWLPYGHVRTVDSANRIARSRAGSGDASIGFVYGSATGGGPVAVQGFVTLPTGGSAVGAGDWGAGLRVPVQFDLGHGVAAALTPEIDAAVNASGKGRHVEFGGATGLSLALAGKLSLGVDLAAFRNDDPGGAATIATAGQSLAWQAGKSLQFDFGAAEGLNRSSPRARLYAGIAKRF